MKRFLLVVWIVAMGLPVWAAVLQRAQVGDTLQCDIIYKGDSLLSDFLHKGIAMGFKRTGDADHFAVIEQKNDSIVAFSVYDKKNEKRIVTGSYSVLFPDSMKRHGIWDWYDDAHPVIRQSYSLGSLQYIAALTYDEEGRVFIEDRYISRKVGKKKILHHASVTLYSPSGEKAAVATIPLERMKNNSNGILAVNPSSAVYYDDMGHERTFDNSMKVQKAIQKYIRKNFQCPKLVNAWDATAYVDVCVRTDCNGVIRIIRVDKDVCYGYTMFNHPAHGELDNKIAPALNAYLQNELTYAEIASKPAFDNKTPIETIQYLTVSIPIRTSK